MASVSFHGLDLSFLKNSPPLSPKWREARKVRNEVHPARSDLPCPMIISDNVEYRSTITGEPITSRSQHREHLKRHGCIEVGSEMPKLVDKETRRRQRRKEVQGDLVEALKMHEQGYRAPKAESAEAAGFGSVNINGVSRSDVPDAKPSIIIP